MNTKLIMTLSAVILGVSGIVLTFVPDHIAITLHLNPGKMTQLLLQIIGSLYFAFAMLNWMTKGSLIGGIYNRPIAVANFTHFLIAGIAILKMLTSQDDRSLFLLVAGIVYAFFGLIFGILLFRHPVKTDAA